MGLSADELKHDFSYFLIQNIPQENNQHIWTYHPIAVSMLTCTSRELTLQNPVLLGHLVQSLDQDVGRARGSMSLLCSWPALSLDTRTQWTTDSHLAPLCRAVKENKSSFYLNAFSTRQGNFLCAAHG